MISELSAVNTMLSAIGGAPVNSITGPVSVDVASARNILEEVRQEVLMTGWSFNTSYRVPLTPQPDGRIRLPASTLRIDASSDTPSWVDPVQRGEWLFDRKAQSYTFSGPFQIDLIIDLAWSEMPMAAQRYITAKAARVFVARMDGDEKRIRMAQVDEMSAMAVLKQHELEVGDYSIFDNETAFRILYRGH